MPAPIARVGTLQEGHEQHTVMLKITLRAHKRPPGTYHIDPNWGAPSATQGGGGHIMSSPQLGLDQ